MTNDPGAALSLLCLGTSLGLPAQAVHCFAAHPARSGMPFSGNRLISGLQLSNGWGPLQTWGNLSGAWVQPDLRDRIVDFVRD